MTLVYNNMQIDISGFENQKLFDCNEKRWIGNWKQLTGDWNIVRISEQDIRCITKEDLIRYKKILGRPEDLEDIRQIL